MSFRNSWWLPGPHSTTLWGRMGRREPVPVFHFETINTPDGDFVELAHVNTAVHDTDHASVTPRLLILHGLEGGTHSHYVHGLVREAGARGWNVTLLLFRTCGPTANRLPRSYHSGETSDASFVIEQLTHRFPDAPLGLVGVSLGGNVLCKLLGERKEALPESVKAAAAISVPFELARASRHIGRGFGKLYEWSFLRSLVPKSLRKIERHTELARLDSIRNARTLWEFDDQFTAPVHGFESAADYYERSSSLQYLAGIRLPILLLSATDDPFLPADVLDKVREVAASNPALHVEFTKRGGHVGFVSGHWPWKPFYYGEWRAAEFLSPFLTSGFAQSASGAHGSETGDSRHNLSETPPAILSNASS